MKLTTKQKWIKTIAWLRRNFPVEYSVSVKSIILKKECGYTEFGAEGGFSVNINRKQSLALRIDTLIHEWAHVLSWFSAEALLEDHSGEWGLAYAKIYRTFVEWNYGEGPRQDEE